MAIVPSNAALPISTNLTPLPALLTYTESLGLERWLERPKRGIATLVVALLWFVLAWQGSGRPEHVWNCHGLVDR